MPCKFDNLIVNKEHHDYLWHSDKRWAYLCPCGFGCLVDKEMRDHIKHHHAMGSMDSRRCALDAYWWEALPKYRGIYICSKCPLRTPIQLLHEKHRCEDFQAGSALPKQHEFLQYIGKKHKPVRPYVKFDDAPRTQNDSGFVSPAAAADSANTSRATSEHELGSPTQPEIEFGNEEDETMEVDTRDEATEESSTSDDGTSHAGDTTSERTETSANSQRSGRTDSTRKRQRSPSRRRRGASGRITRTIANDGSSEALEELPQDEKFDAASGTLSVAAPKPASRRPDQRGELTAKNSNHFPVWPLKLKRHGFAIATSTEAKYRKYNALITSDGKRKVLHRGFLVGNDLQYPAVVMTAFKLECGSYIVTDVDGDIVADAYATVHATHMQHTTGRKTDYQYNPLDLPLVADMLDLTMEPASATFHLAFSDLLKIGEYRMTRQGAKGRYEIGQLFVENARTKKPKTPSEKKALYL